MFKGMTKLKWLNAKKDLTLGSVNASYRTYVGLNTNLCNVICKDGMLYHFYCAVRPMVEGDIPGMYNEFRCITVARSEPWQV